MTGPAVGLTRSQMSHTCPEQLQHAGYTVERRAELTDIHADAARWGSADAPAATAPSQSAEIKLSSLPTRAIEIGRGQNGLSGVNTRDICHGGNGVRMISCLNPENSRVSRGDQRGQPKRHAMKKPTRRDARLAAAAAAPRRQLC